MDRNQHRQRRLAGRGVGRRLGQPRMVATDMGSSLVLIPRPGKCLRRFASDAAGLLWFGGGAQSVYSGQRPGVCAHAMAVDSAFKRLLARLEKPVARPVGQHQLVGDHLVLGRGRMLAIDRA